VDLRRARQRFYREAARARERARAPMPLAPVVRKEPAPCGPQAASARRQEGAGAMRTSADRPDPRHAAPGVRGDLGRLWARMTSVYKTKPARASRVKKKAR